MQSLAFDEEGVLFKDEKAFDVEELVCGDKLTQNASLISLLVIAVVP